MLDMLGTWQGSPTEHETDIVSVKHMIELGLNIQAYYK